MADQFKPLLDRVKDINKPEPVDATPGKIRKLSDHTVKPRGTPKGTVLIKQEKDEVILRVRFVLRFWWPFLPLGLLFFTIFIAPWVGSIIGAAISSWDNNLVFETILALMVLSAIGTYQAFQKTRGMVTVIAQKDKIKFGDKTYDQHFYGGVRIGYEVDNGDTLKNDFFDLSGGSTALRLAYGRWGEDLPYLVNKYHAPEIVIWMNELIDAVAGPDPSPNDATQGRREQNF